VTIPGRIEHLATRESIARGVVERIREQRARLNQRAAVAEHARIVVLGGGDYIAGMLGDLVLFNSPATGSTLALREADLTPDAVRQHIAESNAKFGVRS
jgi:hypothetical protein